jgi:hypothetical protein
MQYILTGKHGERAIIDTENLNTWLNENPAMKGLNIIPLWVYQHKQIEDHIKLIKSKKV